MTKCKLYSTFNCAFTRLATLFLWVALWTGLWMVSPTHLIYAQAEDTPASADAADEEENMDASEDADEETVEAEPTQPKNIRSAQVKGMLPGGEFAKIWLGLEPAFYSASINLFVEWDRPNALQNGLGFYILDDQGLRKVIDGDPAHTVSIGSGDDVFEGFNHQMDANFRATRFDQYTIIIFNDSQSDANFTMRASNGFILDASNQVQDLDQAEDAEEEMADSEAADSESESSDETSEATASEEATSEETSTVEPTETPIVAESETESSDSEEDTEAETIETETMDEEEAEEMAESSDDSAQAVMVADVIEAKELSGDLSSQFSMHFFGVRPSIYDGNIRLTLKVEPQDNSEILRNMNFWVLDGRGIQRFFDPNDDVTLNDMALAAGSPTFRGFVNERMASFQILELSEYTVIVYNNSNIPGNYTLAVDGGILIDRDKQTKEAMEMSMVQEDSEESEGSNGSEAAAEGVEESSDDASESGEGVVIEEVADTPTPVPPTPTPTPVPPTPTPVPPPPTPVPPAPVAPAPAAVVPVPVGPAPTLPPPPDLAPFVPPTPVPPPPTPVPPPPPPTPVPPPPPPPTPVPPPTTAPVAPAPVVPAPAPIVPAPAPIVPAPAPIVPAPAPVADSSVPSAPLPEPNVPPVEFVPDFNITPAPGLILNPNFVVNAPDFTPAPGVTLQPFFIPDPSYVPLTPLPPAVTQSTPIAPVAPVAPVAPAPASSPPTPVPAVRQGQPGGTYVVQPGDTMSLISRDIYGEVRFYTDICSFNGLSDCSVIEVGDTLNLPTRDQINQGIAPVAPQPSASQATPVPATSTPVTATDAASNTSTNTEAITDPVDTTPEEAPSAPDTATSTLDIVDTLTAAGNFTSLVAALEAAELSAPLRTPGPFTLLAPSNAAFDALPEGALDQLLAKPDGQLTQILLYHIIPGQLYSNSLRDGEEIPTQQGAAVFLEVQDNFITVNGANISVFDIQAGNGVIHVIDAVILPPID